MGTSFSFTVIVGLMAVSLDLTQWSPARKKSRRATEFKPPPVYQKRTQVAAASRIAAAPGDGAVEAGAADGNGPAPAVIEVAEQPLIYLSEGKLERETAARQEQLRAAAAQHLSSVQRDLRRQVAALKKSRNRMLDELAGELAGMRPELAAAEVRLLDDESATLTLSRLSASKRAAVLIALDRKRALILDRRVRTLAAKK